ncbi:MAG: sigma-70 family RNA polymerase sigma factor [Planctomycetes bacterium]|nr:sigma-70 family RNA polymerase sigma factor [Planctomycetota bacterium]
MDELVARLLPSLRAFVRQRMGAELRAREESGDIVQSVAREVLRHSDRFRHGGESGFRDWLFTTAHRKIVDRLEHWRAGKREGAREERIEADVLAATGPSPSLHASAREQLSVVEAAFARLSADERDVVTWSRLQGLSHAEIAARLGKSEAATRKVLSRGIARLAILLADADRAPPALTGDGP